ncbi:NAD(P)H-dependent oxidoreductase [Streptomyces sp. DSM 44915]|uniref:NAD(P)H-dependent oxidoreductase n=1 Tax=Streptomyces chisholmiae TaxID=3075540 RepID=A0ABU2JQI7_9ACTN|nr:NAD(P)H-dependent oxidoreductase [Streptomyces sp. DSM 44915]MDT0266998.1 NAD(P)H-dependent oxidoreductase [Streptomyces sp. DSM 44915]
MTRDSAGRRTPLRLAVLVGSTREGRVGEAVGAWVLARVEGRDDLVAEAVDLADYVFPARFPEEPTAEMCRFARAIDAAEGFVVVTPEYNGGYPASLKQAVDYAYDEWHAKPVGFVSYGHGGCGQFAVAGLRLVFNELRTVPVRDCVAIDLAAPLGGPAHAAAADAMLAELRWWGLALREAKLRRPYVG